MKLYICVLDEVPAFIVPTLVAHSVLGAHTQFCKLITDLKRDSDEIKPYLLYLDWLETSFKKCVVKVNRKEFDKISNINGTYLGHENKTLEGIKSCAVALPVKNKNLPNVLKFAKLWSPE